MKFLPENVIKKVRTPVIQVMGENLSLSVFSLIDREVHIVQKVMDVRYPRTIRQLKEGRVEKIINLLKTVDVS